MSELIFTSTNNNLPYYYDPVSNKTSWYPIDFNTMNEARIKEANDFKPPDLTEDPIYINPNYAVNSKKYGYNYFFNTETKKSNWEIPRIPVHRILSVTLDFHNSEWKQSDSDYDVIMKWLDIHVPKISWINAVDLPLEIEWVIKPEYTFRVYTNVYDALSPWDLEVFYELLKDPDHNGNYPIYYDLATNILSLEQPKGDKNTDWVSSLVFLRYVNV